MSAPAVCRACGARIAFMVTEKGRSMPCERELRLYWADPQGPDRVINHGGAIVRCRLTGDPETATGLGRVPHWGQCKAPEKLKRRRRAAGTNKNKTMEAKVT